MKVKVTYGGFLQIVQREFPNLKLAELWLKQIGKWKNGKPLPGVKISALEPSCLPEEME